MAKAVFLVGDDPTLLKRLETDLGELGVDADIFIDVDACIAAEDGDAADLLIVNCSAETCSEKAAKLRRRWPMEKASILLLVDPEGVDTLAVDDQVDDIILTTYDLTELSARLKRLVSRTTKAYPSQRIVVGSLIIDFESFEVSVGDQVVPLTFREYELLRFLAGNRGRVFTRKVLVERIWEYDYLSGTRTVDVHVRRLRSKLGARYGSMIETVRNVGYRFSRHDLP